MIHDRAGRAAGERSADLNAWIRDTLVDLSETRHMAEFWLRELAHYVEGEGCAVEPGERRKAICERTRMVLVAGETLHNLTRIFVRWSGRPAPEAAWDLQLAALADGLLTSAATITADTEYGGNCAERLEYVRGMWPHWCRGFTPEEVASA